ncbi:MAG: flagellin [Mobilitalea sp.]
MRINHNISALKANNQLAKTNAALDASLEKLSSGYRINSAADDSAGLAISEKMRTQINGLDQSSRNASDGISVIQTAEGALVEVEAMLQRMRELSVEAANGTYTSSDRVAIQGEVDQLNAEVQRISDTTEFNTMTLLDGNIDRKSYSSDNNVSLVSLSDTVAVGDYIFDVTEDARQAVILGAQIDYGTYTGERKITADEAGSISVNGESIDVNEGDTITAVYEKLRDAGDIVDVDVFAVVAPPTASATENLDTAGYESQEIADDEHLAFVSRESGSKESVTVLCDNPDLCMLFGLTITGATSKGFDVQGELTTATGSLFESTATMSIEGNKVTVSDSNDFEMVFEVNPGTTGTVYLDCEISDTITAPAASTLDTNGTTQAITVSVLKAGPMDLQIGANEGQTMSVRIPEVTPKTLGIDNINVGTAEGAEKAITALDDAINTVSAIRSKLGAYQNRLEHSIANLDTTSENMTESLSRIEDVDMAEEMAEYTQKNVLAQAGTSMLAQANQRPQAILTLLQS